MALDGLRWWDGGTLGSPDQQVYGDRVFSLSIVVRLFDFDGVAQISDFLRQNAVVGVEFRIGGNTHYGYVHVDFRREHQVWRDGGGGFIYGWAYETQPDTPIQTKALALPALAVNCRISVAAPGVFALSWDSEEAAVYRLRGVSEVTNSFLDITENLTALSTNATVFLTPPTNHAAYFWRVIRIY